MHRITETLVRAALVTALLAVSAVSAVAKEAEHDTSLDLSTNWQSAVAKEAEHSGYLSDETYAKLEKIETPQGKESMRWLGPKLSFANYKSILLDDVVFYPEPEPGPQVSAETLQDTREYLTENLVAKVSTVLNVVPEQGPGVLRMQTAITGVEIKTEGIKAREVRPIVAIFSGVKAIAGKRNRDVLVFLEVEFSDSQSGEVIGAAVHVLEGKQLKDKKDELEMSHLQDSLDFVTDKAQEELSEALGKH